MSDAASLKDAGNKAFAAKQYSEAIDHFTQAIQLDRNNHVLWSNRSASKAGLKDWLGALEDADQTIKVNPKWSKGYARRGAALHGAHRYAEAITAYEEGIKIEDSPALQKGLKEVKDAQAREEAAEEEADMGGLGKMFSDPNLIAKLASNPKTQPLLSDPAFVAKVLGALMGIDMQGFERPEGSTELPPGVTPMSPPSASSPSPASSAKAAASAAPQPPSTKVPEPKDEPMEEVEETEEDKQKKEALELKAKGSELYKKRDFTPAAENFQKAWDLWPHDITFLTNLAAVQFEAGDYDAAISTCEKAVEHGRELRADFKIIAKAFGRIGTAYMRKDDMDNAIKFFSKSLSEHRTPDILNKLRDCEKLKKERDATAYINPEEAEKAREEGNTKFKAGDFAGAVKSYTEAIKRSPNDPKGYNNRSNAYTKLMALPEALKDAEKAIEVDPKFIKAYIRKSVVLCSMREYTKAMEAAQEGSEHDVDQKHAAELEAQMQKCAAGLYSERSGETEEETLARATRDPEVAKIMQDPIMQQILQQAQSDPASLQDHMKNPQVRANIQKLVAAGIIKTR
ncbi:Hsp90 cochaperone [Tulasnella sp. 330]|nr:Hsp90 cochaperone [Tulasnella sp. 330]KAG8872580.1 Hsp90 cochaperone [Tulasnella sp. 331]